MARVLDGTAIAADIKAEVQAEVERGLVAAVVVEAGSAADVAAVADSAGQEAATVPEPTAMAGSSAIAEIAGDRAFTAICRSSGRALSPMPSRSR